LHLMTNISPSDYEYPSLISAAPTGAPYHRRGDGGLRDNA
jgi:hypothetical protein